MQAFIVNELPKGIAIWNLPVIAVFLFPFLAFDFKFSLGLLRLLISGAVLFFTPFLHLVLVRLRIKAVFLSGQPYF